MENNSKSGGVIDNLKPKAAFKAGLLTGLAIMFVIGFFVLLGFILNGKIDTSKDDKTSNTNTNTNVNVVDNGANDLAPQNIQLQEVDKDKDWIRGNKNGKITIVEFSDADCPYCSRFHETMNQIIADNDDVRWVYRHFPLTRLHPEAQKKAIAIECVGEQKGNDAVWEFMDKIFVGNETLANIADVAAEVGVDKNKFQSCLDENKYLDKVNDQSAQAQKAGATGTPYSVLVVGDQKVAIPGALPLESVQSMIDTLR